MDIDSEARAFAARKDRRKVFLPGRRQDIDLETVRETLIKLREVKDGMWKEKVITSDPKHAAMIVEAINEVNLKIADYENQLKVLNARPRTGERQTGR